MADENAPRQAGGWAGDLVRDLIGMAGLACITTGLWQIHPPTALVTLGVLLFGLAVCPALMTPRGGD